MNEKVKFNTFKGTQFVENTRNVTVKDVERTVVPNDCEWQRLPLGEQKRQWSLPPWTVLE